MPKRVFAIAAHPDDIEFMMAGTLALLGQAGYELHYMTVANGCLGSMQHDTATTARIRRAEAAAAAHIVGATFHESLVPDLEIFYEDRTLRRLASVVRQVAPDIILTQSTNEYMEDHMNTTRLVLTAAFARCMPNYVSDPPRPAISRPVAIYHALPYGLRDPLGQPVQPAMFVNISDVIEIKRQMLSLHASQKEWLDVSQGMGAYVRTMEQMAAEVGRMSGCFAAAEGWSRHLHLGYCAEDDDPLAAALGSKADYADET